MKEYYDIQLGKRARLVLPSELVAETIAIERGEICPIPGVKDAYLGVISRRGKLLWVLDLAEFLSDLMGFNPPPLAERGLAMSDGLTLAIVRKPSSSANSSSANSSTKKTASKLAIKEEEALESQIICAVSAARGGVFFNPDNFEALPPKSERLLGKYFSGLTEIRGEGEDKKTAIAAVLNVSALFAALESKGKATPSAVVEKS